MTSRFLTAGATAVAFAALALVAPIDRLAAQQDQQLQTVPTQTPSSPSSIPPADLDFVLKAAMGGMEEVALADLAQQKATSEEVKRLAALIAQEHTQANQDLMRVASEKGIPVPNSTGQAAQTVAAAMSELSGRDFDMQYLLQQHAAHLAAVQLFQNAAKHAMDPQVRGFAETYAPKIQAHAAQIEQVSLKMMGKPGPATSSP